MGNDAKVKTIRMTFEQAIQYLESFNGVECTIEQFYKAYDFIKSLPQSPKSSKDMCVTRAGCHEAVLTNYDIQKRYDVKFKHHFGKFYFGIFGESDVENPYNREIPKSNEEALELIKQHNNVKFASDIDKYYEMSEDPRVSKWARELNSKSEREQSLIACRL